jgi:hypothetical protein
MLSYSPQTPRELHNRLHVRVHRPITANRAPPPPAGRLPFPHSFTLNVLPPLHKARAGGFAQIRRVCSCDCLARSLSPNVRKIMASSSRCSSPRLHHRYQYQMLPSKDESALRVTESPQGLLANESDDGPREIGDVKLPWKTQVTQDLKPSTHRDT